MYMHEFIYMQKQTKNNNKTNKQSSCIHKISSSSASFQLEMKNEKHCTEKSDTKALDSHYKKSACILLLTTQHF